ncbi:MAG: tyrosine-type recombinase/integrase, partial [Nitrospirae bacterium]|nr:tyrosine-type recombinase/integrase [Nitrospirota bacterium]
AKVRDFHFHDLRHTFASHLVMAGVDLTTVKELLGHRDIKMTLRYAHLAPAHKAKALDILDNTLNGVLSVQKVYNLAVGG